MIAGFRYCQHDDRAVGEVGPQVVTRNRSNVEDSVGRIEDRTKSKRHGGLRRPVERSIAPANFHLAGTCEGGSKFGKSLLEPTGADDDTRVPAVGHDTEFLRPLTGHRRPDALRRRVASAQQRCHQAHYMTIGETSSYASLRRGCRPAGQPATLPAISISATGGLNHGDGRAPSRSCRCGKVSGNKLFAEPCAIERPASKASRPHDGSGGEAEAAWQSVGVAKMTAIKYALRSLPGRTARRHRRRTSVSSRSRPARSKSF